MIQGVNPGCFSSDLVPNELPGCHPSSHGPIEYIFPSSAFGTDVHSSYPTALARSSLLVDRFSQKWGSIINSSALNGFGYRFSGRTPAEGDTTSSLWFKTDYENIFFSAVGPVIGLRTGLLGYSLTTSAVGSLQFVQNGKVYTTAGGIVKNNTWTCVHLIHTSSLVSLYINAELFTTIDISTSPYLSHSNPYSHDLFYLPNNLATFCGEKGVFQCWDHALTAVQIRDDYFYFSRIYQRMNV